MCEERTEKQKDREEAGRAASFEIDRSEAALRERYALSMERFLSFSGETVAPAARGYFEALRSYIVLCDESVRLLRYDRETNARIFYEESEAGYENSFLNPAYAKKMLSGLAAPLCVWYYELRGLYALLTDGRISECAALLETSLQLLGAFEEAFSEEADGLPRLQTLKDILFFYFYDYTEEWTEQQIAAQYAETESRQKRLVMESALSDLSETSYLYRFGERITEEELGTARLLLSLPDETIEQMAAAEVDGYLRGFALTGKSLAGKERVEVSLPLGFERLLRAVIRRFEEAGLSAILRRPPVHLTCRRLSGNVAYGVYGTRNSAMLFDHREDLALLQGDRLKTRRIEALQRALRLYQEEVRLYSGVACMEVFGEEPASPQQKNESLTFTSHQKEVNRQLSAKTAALMEEFLPSEETSFCIIAWPRPAVADDDEARYRTIFEEMIRINTLPLDRWQSAQQCLIDALDRAVYAFVRGAGENETNLRIMLSPIEDPAHETKFENCLADVNIPAGEVFTSPVLAGTEGVLHVENVFIGGCCFRNLKLYFTDGRISSYSCDNGETKEAGMRLIEQLIFHDRQHLPMGEFAIGTNTAADRMARRYALSGRLPILIAEKTGPHFAVGDTCYAHEEELSSFNPDGKRMIARSNACSDLRSERPEEAYFEVHTDITIPYAQIAEVSAVSEDGSSLLLLRNGRFVLKGTEVFNEALDEA